VNRLTHASSGGAVGRNRHGLVRLAPVAMIAGLALVASMAFASPAFAADGPPIVSPVTVDELGYTTAKISATTESEPYYGENNATLYCFEYALAGEPPFDEKTKWKGGTNTCYGIFGPGGKATLSDEFIKLKPDTTYQVRLGAFNGYGPNGFSLEYSPQPYTTFTTKHVNKPSGTLAISNVTLNTAHITGTVSTNAPPGPLDAAQKAAYRTEWQIICRPSCQFGTVSSTGAVGGDEPTQPITWDTIRLETNTYYEVELTVTNADGSQAVVVEEFFSTPNIAAKVKPAPGGSSGKGAYSVGGVVTPYNTKITDCHFEYGPTTEYVYSAPCSPQPVGRNEIQKFSIGATAGTFRLLFRGQETDNIPLGADEKIVEEELQALSAIGPQGVTKVVRGYGFFEINYEIFFGGPLSGTNLNPIRVINGNPPVFIEGQGIPGCCDGDSLGFAGSILDGGNNNPTVVEAHLTGLTPGATYHYKLFATNNVGTSTTEDIRFVAPLAVGDNPCPNEAVRIENSSTRLPECRAYELVTTAFTTGYSTTLQQMSVNDGTVMYSSLAGNIANSGYGGLFSTNYIAERHANGWETVANLNGARGSLYAPPFSLTNAYPYRYAPDLIHSMWYVQKPGQNERAYIREPDGTFSELSTYSPTEFGDMYISGSDDYSHTLWTGNTAYNDGWAPGVGPGLYEYIGRHHTDLPFRVDVNNADEPVSECFFGSYFSPGPWQTAFMSHDGRTVGYSVEGCKGGNPEFAQIWARVDESKSYFASESQCTRKAGDPGGACNAPPPTIEGNYVCTDPCLEYMGGDGSSLVFSTTQQLVNGDIDQTRDLYEYILPTASDPNPSPNLIQVSAGGPNAKVRNFVRGSEDGSTVYFIAQGVLASNHSAQDEAPFPGDYNLYSWHRDAAHPYGETKFIARLEDPPNNYDVSAFGGYKSQVTPDGRYLLFLASHPLTETDTDNSIDLYRYDEVKGELTRVSVDNAGVGGNIDFSDADTNYRNSISNNGQQVVFTTSEALSPEDGNGGPDAYLWQAGHTSLISTGSVGGGAGAVSIDGSGQDIYITSAQQLTADDIDEVSDVYDARRGGGFSFKELPPCAGEACQPAGTPAPDNGAAATDQGGGEGNYQPASISIKGMSASQRAKLAAGGKAEVPLKVSGPGKISLKGTARFGKKPSEVIDAASRAVQAGVVNVPVTLSQRALSRLQKTGVLSVHLAALVADSDTATATLKLTTAEARHKRSKKGNG
jgi:hypothetical protein